MPAIEISPELCEFVGAMIGNGNLWTDGSRYRVELTGDPLLDKAYFDYLSELACSLFEKNPYPIRVHQRALRLRLQSKSAYTFLTELGIPSGSGKAREVRIPERIVNEKWNWSDGP